MHSTEKSNGTIVNNLDHGSCQVEFGRKLYGLHSKVQLGPGISGQVQKVYRQ